MENDSRKRYDWSNIDWGKQDVGIACELNCSRERVRQKRKELGKGRSLLHHKKRTSILNYILDIDTSLMDLNEIAEKAGCSKAYVKEILTKNGKSFIFSDGRKGGKYAWDRADWTQTDKEVAFALGVPNVGVVTGHRRRMGLIKSRVSKFSKEPNNWGWGKVISVKENV